MVNIYGAGIDRDILQFDELNFAHWQRFAYLMLQDILTYSTCWAVVTSLMEQKEVVECFRLNFLGNFDIYIGGLGLEEELMAHFLASLGVLSPNAKGSRFKTSSPMINLLIHKCVIPVMFPIVPSPRIPPKLLRGYKLYTYKVFRIQYRYLLYLLEYVPHSSGYNN